MRLPAATLASTLALVVCTLAHPRDASANGRFPKAQQIVTVPGSSGRTIVLRATFGLLLSKDAGASWEWVCEQAMGFSGTWDPPIAATQDGRVWVGLPDGLSSSIDGCGFTRAPELAGESVVDVANDPTGGGVVIVTSTPGKPAFVWRRPSSKAPYARLGQGIANVIFDTVDVAPSKPTRVYATAAPLGAGKRAHLFRSDDGGTTLKELDVHLEKDGRLFLSSIDPKDPDRILVRHTNETGTNLLLSKDGGASFMTVLMTTSSMFGFAMSPDGASVFAGAGDASEGLFRSSDRGETFTSASKTSVLCLFADGAQLLACSNPYSKGGWAVAASGDGAATFRPLLTFEDVHGPITCDASVPSSSTCASSWPDVRAQVIAPAKAAQVDASSPDAGARGPEVGPLDASAEPALPARRACGCGASRDAGSSALPFTLLLALLAFARRLDRV